MKKRFFYTLAGACLTAALLVGCAGPNTPETIPDEHPVASLTDGTEGTEGITSANAFARAIVSGATVELGEGTILLEPDSGDLQTGNSFCRWESVYEGYELVISNVSNVTIRGAGQGKTTLESNPRAATVLTFENCENVTLEGFTAGHVPGAEPCEGNVINLTNSSYVTMKDLGLFGCGAIGVRADCSTNLTLEGCDIYECSAYGLNLDFVEGCQIKGCTLRDIGSEMMGNSVLNAWDGSDLTVTDTSFKDNKTYDLFTLAQSATFTRCSFENNQMQDIGFNIYTVNDSSQVVLDGCTGQGNRGWNWLQKDDFSIISDAATGKELTEEDMVKAFGQLRQETTVSTAEQETVTVTTVDEFLAALGSNREIIIDAPMLDLSTATGYKDMTGGENYDWSDPYDGPQLNIRNLDNLTIRGKDGKGANVISAVPRYAQVLCFEGCTNLTVKDLTLGHTKEPGYCVGGVLDLQRCTNVTVENTGLFGCGTIGIQGYQCVNMALSGNEIYECSYGGISLNQCQKVDMTGNTFRDLGEEYGGYIYNISGCTDLTFDGANIPGDDYLEYTK